MNNVGLKQTLSTIHSFEDYQEVKSDIEEALAIEIIQKHQLPKAPLVLFSDGTNIVFSYGDSKVIKIFPPVHFDQFESERLVLSYYQQT
ncbi:MAG: hypothetical protein LCH30_02825 [Proteobacteria bacterium]|nr:hypothetical protein [Pseudomonadota bacterium]